MLEYCGYSNRRKQNCNSFTTRNFGRRWKIQVSVQNVQWLSSEVQSQDKTKIKIKSQQTLRHTLEFVQSTSENKNKCTQGIHFLSVLSSQIYVKDIVCVCLFCGFIQFVAVDIVCIAMIIAFILFKYYITNCVMLAECMCSVNGN